METEVVSCWDPRVIHGLLTLTAAVIASATALYISIAVYKQQKKIDQGLVRSQELRAAFARFLGEFEQAVTAARTNNSQTLPDAGTQLLKAYSVLSLYATATDLEKAWVAVGAINLLLMTDKQLQATKARVEGQPVTNQSLALEYLQVHEQRMVAAFRASCTDEKLGEATTAVSMPYGKTGK